MDWVQFAAMLWAIGQLIGIALAVIVFFVGIIYVVVQTLRGH